MLRKRCQTPRGCTHSWFITDYQKLSRDIVNMDYFVERFHFLLQRFLEAGGGGGGGGCMKSIEKNCLHGLKRQNKLLANMMCVKKLVCISKKKV